MPSRQEIFDVVDEDGNVIGQAPRSLCHGNPTFVHRAVHVLLFNDKGDLLLQKRSSTKDIQPGKWDTSVGGHLDVGENFLQAARREMAEELGVVGVPLTFLYHSKIRNSIESENITTYLAKYSGEVHFNPEEISNVRYWSADEIELHFGKGLFTPNFEDEWTMFKNHCRHYLASGREGIGFCAGDSFPDIIHLLDE